MQRDLLVRWALTFLILLISFGGLIYGFTLLFFITTTPGEKLLSALFIFLLTINTIFNIVGCYYYIRSYGLDKFVPRKIKGRLPRVVVVVPCRNEDEEMVKENLASLKSLNYPSDRISFHLIDNSDKPSKELEQFCNRIGFNYIFMENPIRLKSYVLNKFLKGRKEEVIAIFDADERLTDPNFLLETLPYLEKDVGFVQTLKEFEPGSFFANAVNVYYLFFYKFMQPVRSLTKSTMFCGSCGLVRRSVWKKVGGFPDSPTEDLAFAFKADMMGMGGVFVPKRYALGKAIESFSTFLAQQWRYTIGNSWIIGDYLRNFRRLDFERNLHYLSQTFGYVYLSYLFVFYTFMTLAFVFYDISLRSLYSQVILPEYAKIMAITYIFAIIFLVVLGAKLYFGSFRSGLLAFFLNFAAAIVRVRALVVGILRLPTRFVMTAEQRGRRMNLIDALKSTKYETGLALILLIVAFVSFLRSDVISMFWLTWYSWLFSCAFLFMHATDVKG